jgi:hypothetical protein
MGNSFHVFSSFGPPVVLYWASCRQNTMQNIALDPGFFYHRSLNQTELVGLPFPGFSGSSSGPANFLMSCNGIGK